MYDVTSLTVSDPPPVYSEKPTHSKSPEHLLVPRLSSVEELHEASLSPTADGEGMTMHGLDHTFVTMATTKETINDSEIASEPITVITTTPKETNEHVTMTTSSEVTNTVTMTTSSEVKNNTVSMSVTPEVENPITTTNSAEVDVAMTSEPITVITTTPKETNEHVTSEVENPTTTTTSAEVDVAMTTDHASNTSTTSNTDGIVTVVDPAEVQIQVTVNDSM